MHNSVESVLLLQPDWLRKRIVEAAMWTNAELSKTSAIQVIKEKLWRGKHPAQLRSTLLDPRRFGAESSLGDHHNLPTRDAVEGLVQRRAELTSARFLTDRRDGKLLLFTPQDSLADGAATLASDGFFDIDNVPAWDTWVYFDGKMLLSWIPPQLFPKVQSGIDANAEGCLRWADDADP